AERNLAACSVHRRGAFRRAGQPDQQPAGRAGAAAARRAVWRGRHPGGAARRQHRSEPDVHRVTGNAAVAPRAPTARVGSVAQGIHDPGTPYRPRRAGARRARTVGGTARTGRLNTMTGEGDRTYSVLVWIGERTWQACVDAAR